MPVNRGHLGTMRLLPFAAAAVDVMAFSMQTRCMKVYEGR